MKIALVDNGSLEAEPHLRLRRIASEIGARAGAEVEAVSWRHSDRIEAAKLGGVPAQTIAPWMRRELALGRREFTFIPFFISPQGAIGSALRADIERLGATADGFACSFAGSLAEAGVLPEIIADRIQEAISSRRIAGRPAVVVVDHGGPSRASAALRDRIADSVRERLGASAGPLSPASMESPGDGPEFGFNRPLLAELLDRPGFDSGDVVIAPLFISPGRHAAPDGDLGRIAREAQARHPRLRCHFTALVGGHPRVAETLARSLVMRAASPAIPAFT